MATRKKLDVKAVLSGYKPPNGMSVPQIIAHLAYTMSMRMPLQPVPWAWVAKICNNRPKLPPEDGTEVRLIKSRLSRAREICRAEYQRDITHIPGFGIRGTVSASDVARRTYVTATSRVRSTARRAQEIGEIIDPKSIPERELRDFVENSKQGLRVFQNKVLPLLEPKEPLTDQDKKEKK